MVGFFTWTPWHWGPVLFNAIMRGLSLTTSINQDCIWQFVKKMHVPRALCLGHAHFYEKSHDYVDINGMCVYKFSIMPLWHSYTPIMDSKCEGGRIHVIYHARHDKKNYIVEVHSRIPTYRYWNVRILDVWNLMEWPDSQTCVYYKTAMLLAFLSIKLMYIN